MSVPSKHNRLPIIALVLSVLLAGLLSCVSVNVYAAGEIRIDLADIESVGEDFPGFTFNLYKVGGYNGESFILDPDYPDVNVLIPKKRIMTKPGRKGILPGRRHGLHLQLRLPIIYNILPKGNRHLLS